MIEFVKDADNSMFIEKSRISNIKKEATTITIYTNGLLEISDKITITVTAGYEDIVADKLISVINDNDTSGDGMNQDINMISTDYIFSISTEVSWDATTNEDLRVELQKLYPDGLIYTENKWITAITYTGT